MLFYILISITLFKYGSCTDIDYVEKEARAKILYSSEESCTYSTDCLVTEGCVNSTCLNVCLTECLAFQETCSGVNHEAVCYCKEGYERKYHGLCGLPCPREIKCGKHQECFMVNNVSTCQCQEDLTRDRHAIHECHRSLRCQTNVHCYGFERCYNGQCQALCSKKECTNENEGCITFNNNAACACKAGFAYNPAGQCEQDCSYDSDCTRENEECIKHSNFRYCGCKFGYLHDFTSNRKCRKACGLRSHCDKEDWCKSGLCVPCDGKIC